MRFLVEDPLINLLLTGRGRKGCVPCPQAGMSTYFDLYTCRQHSTIQPAWEIDSVTAYYLITRYISGH